MKKKTVKVSAVLLSLAIALTGTSGGGALSSVIGASGDYDVTEAYAWLDSVLAAE